MRPTQKRSLNNSPQRKAKGRERRAKRTVAEGRGLSPGRSCCGRARARVGAATGALQQLAVRIRVCIFTRSIALYCAANSYHYSLCD